MLQGITQNCPEHCQPGAAIAAWCTVLCWHLQLASTVTGILVYLLCTLNVLRAVAQRDINYSFIKDGLLAAGFLQQWCRTHL